MICQLLPRRNFLIGTVAAAAAALTPRLSPAAEPDRKGPAVRLGGPVDVNSKDPEEMALSHRKLGYRAAFCPEIALSDRERIRDVSQAFVKHDVMLAEVGRWCNLLDADPDRRAANVKTVSDGLALAEALGARCCVDIAGSYNTKSWFGPHPKNLSKEFFDASVENARKIIDAVRPSRAKFCFEMMGWALPDSPDAYLALIKAVDRPAFGVHLDPCNAVTGRANYLRFRLSPSSGVALAARVKRPGKEFVGDQRELYMVEEQPGEESPYERLLGDAMAGDGALFTREDAVESAWAVVEPVLKTHHRTCPYKRGSWGPKEADAIIAGNGSWHNPKPKEASS
jgi:hypothetical protein